MIPFLGERSPALQLRSGRQGSAPSETGARDAAEERDAICPTVGASRPPLAQQAARGPAHCGQSPRRQMPPQTRCAPAPGTETLRMRQAEGARQTAGPAPVTVWGAPSAFKALSVESHSFRGWSPGPSPQGSQAQNPPSPPQPRPRAERALQTPQFPFSLWLPGSPESDESFRCSYGAFLSGPSVMGSSGSPQSSILIA